MKTMCGADCSDCGFKANCNGCIDTDGSPFGGKCVAAEYIKLGGLEKYNQFRDKLIYEFNQLNVPGMPKITELFQLVGSFVNLEYPLPNGDRTKLLKDEDIYLGCQVECEFADNSTDNEARCYGLVGGPDFILVAEYGKDGADPELIIFKRR